MLIYQLATGAEEGSTTVALQVIIDLGVRQRWSVEAGCNPVASRLNRFESYLTHQNSLPTYANR